MIKICIRCNTEQSLKGRSTVCATCTKKRVDAYIAENKSIIHAKRLIRDYNITVEQFNEILALQNGGCAICGTVSAQQRLHIDHNHKCCPGKTSCGKCIRGLLCGKCNVGIGCLNDNIETLMAAAAYLLQDTDVLSEKFSC